LRKRGSSIWIGLRAFARSVPSRVKGYVKENWGAPFVVGFMALLMVAAVSLMMDYIVLANEVAVYAYYALVIGVVLQLACFMKYRKREGEPSK
jgi:heme/copper-type cytochrome/quinol oxidase subunit 4